MSGYIPVGNGIGAAWLATGQLHVVAGPLFAQIERERADGPRYVEAVRGAKRLREHHAQMHLNGWGNYQSPFALYWERAEGIPVTWTDGDPSGWITR